MKPCSYTHAAILDSILDNLLGWVVAILTPKVVASCAYKYLVHVCAHCATCLWNLWRIIYSEFQLTWGLLELATFAPKRYNSSFHKSIIYMSAPSREDMATTTHEPC